MIRTFKYHLYPNRKQRETLNKTLGTCRELYNLCLEQKRMQKISCTDQQKQLVLLKKEFPEYKEVYSDVLIDIIQRLDRAFQDFFRRVKLHQTPGYPRFKSLDRFHSICYWSGYHLEGRHLKLSKVGNIKLKLSREIPNGSRFCNCVIKRTLRGQWYACIMFEYQTKPLPYSPLKVGIDAGIANFTTFSDASQTTPNLRFYEKYQKKLRRAQRRICRREMKSNRRHKAVILLRRISEDIQNQRADFLHKHSRRIVNKYGMIAVEDLNISGMARSNLAKQIYDASWGTFIFMLSYKAVEAGRILRKVPAYFTSQKCPICKYVSKNNRKSQAEFLCEICGYSANADYVGACNILARAELSDANVSVVNECVI